MLKLENVCVNASNKQILRNISLEITDSTAIYGPAKSGKTTLILTIAGVMQHTGKIYSTLNSRKDIGIGMIDKINSLPEELTLRETMEFYAAPLNIKRQNIIDKLTAYELITKSRIKLTKISRLDKAKISLAIATLNSPKIILLDEPTKELNEEEKMEFWKYLRQHVAEKVVFSTTDKTELANVSNIITIHNGECR